MVERFYVEFGASVFEISYGKANKQTNEQTNKHTNAAENFTHTTTVGVGKNKIPAFVVETRNI